MSNWTAVRAPHASFAVPWLAPVERRAIALLTGCVLAAGALLVATTSVRLAELGDVASKFLILAFVSAVVVGAGARLVEMIRLPGSRPDPNRLAWILAAMLIVGLTLPAYGIFKQFVLPVRGFPLDPLLAAIGRTLFFGNDPWRVSHMVFPWVGATVFFDRLYSLWMLLMPAFPILAVVLVRDMRQRIRLVGCWVAAWFLIGGVAAWLLGSAGPCYFTALVGESDRFAQLDALLASKRAAAAAIGMPIGAIEFQRMLLDAYGSGRYAPAGGISAAPSMHVAMAALFAIGGFQVRRWLGWAMAGYCALIWIGSVHLGWHYVVDGLISIPLMLGLWQLSAPALAALERGLPRLPRRYPARSFT